VFGSIFRMKPRSGQEAAVVELFKEWQRERQPRVEGAMGGYVLKPEKSPGELIGVAVFTSKETYFKNAEDPEQDRWFRRLRELLEDDPAWEDGDVLIG